MGCSQKAAPKLFVQGKFEAQTFAEKPKVALLVKKSQEPQTTSDVKANKLIFMRKIGNRRRSTHVGSARGVAGCRIGLSDTQ